MKDYSKFIEEQLNTLMPFSEIYEENKPIQYPVKDAPKVSGYFGFIGLKYMKRVRNIKKLCVEYINTYVDGSLNVANKIDKVDLFKNYKNLATEVGFKVSQGFSTQGNTQSSDNKEGVAFLTGDKAVMDKLNSIKSQIKTYASKSASLTEWASLMVDKSHMIACQIVKEKTDEMIDDKDKENAQKEFDKKLAEADKQIEEEKKKTEELNKQFEKYGDFSQMNTNIYIAKDIDKVAKTDYIKVAGEAIGESEIANERKSFYTNTKSNWKKYDEEGITKAVANVVGDAKISEKFNALSEEEQNQVKNLIVSAYLAKTADVKKASQFLSPIDLKLLHDNLTGVMGKTMDADPIKGYKELKIKVNGINLDDLVKSFNDIKLDDAKLLEVAGEWAYTYTEKRLYADKLTESIYNIEQGTQINETKHYVMGWNEFLKEHLSKKATSDKTIELNEMAGNFEVNMDGVNIQDKCIANGDGIYAYFCDYISMDANRVFVVKDGKVVMPSDKCLEELKIDNEWGRHDKVFGGEIVLSTYNDSEYYGTIGFKHGMEILKKYYPRLKTYYCNVGYHTFPKKWYKTDKDSVYAKECDDMINIVD